MTERITMIKQAGGDLAGTRLDQAAAILFPEFSRARLQAWIREGCLTMDGAQVRPSHKIAGGEVLALDAEPEPDQRLVAQDIPLDLVYEDASILVVNKPAGMVVHPAAGNPDGTLQNALLNHDASLATIPRAGIVHRLDKDTSGIMVVARSLQAHIKLVEQLQARSVKRIYHALVIGCPISGDTVEAPIGRHPKDRKRMAVVSGGKPAISHFRVLQRFNGFGHIQVSLETGRTHQIRVHMQHLGFPLLGDPVYGKRLKKNKYLPADLIAELNAFPRQALHARQLSLIHPESGEAVQYETDLAEDMQDLLSVLQEKAPEKALMDG